MFRFAPRLLLSVRNISLAAGTMPGKAAAAAALQPTTVKTAPLKAFPFVLKKIMDIPPPNILEEGDDGKPKF